MTLEEIEDIARRCEEHRKRGDWGASLECYLRVLEKIVAEGVSPNAATLFVIERVADLSVPFGYFEAADLLLSTLEGMCRENDNDYYADYAVLKRIRLAGIRGDLRAAARLLNSLAPRIGDIYEENIYTPDGLRQWERALQWRNAGSGGRAVMLTLLCLEIGSLWMGLGQYSRALLMFERGLEHASGDVPDLAEQARIPLLLGAAGARLERGDLPGARATLDSIAPHLNPALHPGFISRRLEMLGRLDLMQGEFGSALDRFSEVLKLCASLGAHSAAMKAVLNLSHVRIFLNQTLIARLSLEVVRTEALRIGDRATAARADFLLQLARARNQTLADDEMVVPSVVEMQKGLAETPSTVEQHPRGLDPFDIPQSESFLTFFEDQTIAFHYLLGFRDIPATANYLDRLEDLFASTDSELIRARLCVMRGMVSYYEGRCHPHQHEAKYKQAEMELEEACAHLEAMGLLPELWQARRILTWCRAWLNRGEEAILEMAGSNDRLLSQLASSLSPWERAFYLSNKWTADEEMIAVNIEEMVAMRREAGKLLWPFSLRRRWAVMERIHDLMLHLDRYKGALSRKTITGNYEPDQTTQSTFTLWRRLWRHPWNRVTLSFLVLPDRVLTIQSGFLSLRFSIREIARNRVRELVQRWHLNISPEGSRHLLDRAAQRHLVPIQRIEAKQNLSNEMEAIAFELANALSLPDILQTLPRRIRALTIAPDDSLHGFPFASLRHQDRFLIERFALSLAFETSPRESVYGPRGSGEALLVAVPQGASEAEIAGRIYRLESLPNTLLELDRMEEWLKAKRGINVCRLDNRTAPASKETVLKLLPSASFFHIACHGFSNPERTDQSCLVLIPEEDQVELLTLRELSELSLDKLQHVTLSSCWAADNFVLPGRWVISLPETLWRAGAHSILGCLWPVKDDVAADFMAAFYQNLDRYPRDQALRHTQLAFISKYRPSDGAPLLWSSENLANWAGYNLYGDYRAISLVRAVGQDGILSRPGPARHYGTRYHLVPHRTCTLI
jgi:CHAT domain-containing protein/tetratricopeptide (TPR) repeat protein